MGHLSRGRYGGGLAVPMTPWMTPRVLMCAPDHFGVRYEINPWMDLRKAPDPARARRQWNALAAAYTAAGVSVETVAPHPAQPDLVFTNNAGLVAGRRLLASRFRHKERRGEEAVFAAWAAAAGFEVVQTPSGMFFEGAGDALFCGDTLFVGHGWRTESRAAEWLAQELRVPVVPVKLTDPRFFHLDTCFCPLAPGVAMAAPVAFDIASWRVLEKAVPHLIPVPQALAVTFACSALVVGDRLFGSGPEDLLRPLLAPVGLSPHFVDVSEFLKSGGGVRCLTLPLKDLGAQPAAWEPELDRAA